jgi:hypothetical protein
MTGALDCGFRFSHGTIDETSDEAARHASANSVQSGMHAGKRPERIDEVKRPESDTCIGHHTDIQTRPP